jgi:winged helix DNA-binding protein
MKRERLLRQRLSTQRLASAPLSTAADAVRLLTCVQSQERDHAFFSLGMRTGSSYDAVQAEYDGLAFVRTHILRPTWHFVAPEDLQWIRALTSPRIVSAMTARHRQLGLDDPRLVNHACDVLGQLLRDRTYLSRREIGERFAQDRGLPKPGEQLGHLLLLAELDGLICSGPIKGVHHSYALSEEVVPPAHELDSEEAHVRLAQRFFAGHGPASIKDFTRWSSLTVTATKAALAEIGSGLVRVEIDGITHWFDPATVARRSPTAPAAYLFPVYDEAVLTYPAQKFPALPDHPSSGRTDPFWGPVITGERNVGLWKRTITKNSVLVELRLAPSLLPEDRAAIAIACHRLADFLDLDLEYIER